MNRATAQRVELLEFESWEEMQDYHKAENVDLVEKGLDSKSAEYWRTSERQKAEMTAWQNRQAQIKTASEKAAEGDSEGSVKASKPVGADNRCRVCNEVIPPTGKRGRPAVKCADCKAQA